jgi:hypothetical protein
MSFFKSSTKTFRVFHILRSQALFVPFLKKGTPKTFAFLKTNGFKRRSNYSALTLNPSPDRHDVARRGTSTVLVLRAKAGVNQLT